MSTIYEINMSNAQADIDTGRVKQNSPVVEVFSALAAGKKPDVDAKVLDKSVATLKELSSKALAGDHAAQSEINTIIRLGSGNRSVSFSRWRCVRAHSRDASDSFIESPLASINLNRN